MAEKRLTIALAVTLSILAVIVIATLFWYRWKEQKKRPADVKPPEIKVPIVENPNENPNNNQNPVQNRPNINIDQDEIRNLNPVEILNDAQLQQNMTETITRLQHRVKNLEDAIVREKAARENAERQVVLRNQI